MYNNTIIIEVRIVYYLSSYFLIFTIICICIILRFQKRNRHNMIESPELPESPEISPQQLVHNNITLISNIKCLINDDCPICIEPFKENDELYQLKCGHIFHTECIAEWININHICPTCRKDIINEV